MFRLATLLSLLLVAHSVGRLQAQFATQAIVGKANYLIGEAVEVTVSIVNRSGADVVMGGANGQSWLSFDVSGPDGAQIPMMRSRADDTFVFKAGTSISRKVLVTDTHPFMEYGNYMVAANVYHPPSQQSYTSNRVRVSMTDTKAFWSQPFGVPTGMPGAGQIRRYELVLLRDTERTHIYARMLDDRSNMKLSTYALGQCIMVMNPQVTVDATNTMHVLFMTQPHIYMHVSMDPQGKMSAPTFHKEEGTNRPQLAVNADQRTIGVAGGHVFDPSMPDPTAPKRRSVGDRPPGL